MTRHAWLLTLMLAACARPPASDVQPQQGADARPWGGHLSIDRSPERSTRPCPGYGGMAGPVCEYRIDEFATVRPRDGDGIAVFGTIERNGDALFIRGARAEIAIDLRHAAYVPEGDHLARMLGRRGRAVGYYRETADGAVVEALSLGTAGPEAPQ